jgi:DNA replication protein DnaC
VIRSTYDPSIRTTEIEVLRPVMTAELLVLDDIGAEKTSEWVEETMNLIVNTRYNERRVTIFTSNYEDIPDDTDPNSLLFRIGHRMRSRLHEMCEFVALDAADYRERPQNAAADDLLAMWKMRKKTLPNPGRSGRQARAQLREPSVRDGKADLKWPGGRAGS